ncbi:MAG: Smr/MutS family protein, partial [Amphiplicatus sp.]
APRRRRRAMKRRRLSPEEKALWKKVTRDVRPVAPVAAPDAPAGDENPLLTPVSPSGAARPRPALPVLEPIKKARKPRPPASPFDSGDPALDRSARRGRLRPERTLDLHGLTQGPARLRLETFLLSASRDGLRCVLVITGKGAPGGVLDHDPYAERSRRGVLRERFQDWLAAEPLRSLVTRASQASQADGGRGAFYVFLKASRR